MKRRLEAFRGYVLGFVQRRGATHWRCSLGPGSRRVFHIDWIDPSSLAIADGARSCLEFFAQGWVDRAARPRWTEE